MNAGHTPARTSARRRTPLVRLVLLVLIGLCILSVISYSSRLQRLGAVMEDIAHWEQEIAEAEQRNAELEAELAAADSPDSLAAIARGDLGLTMPGDTVIVVVETTPAPAIVAPDAPAGEESEALSTPAETGLPVWRQWLEIFADEE